MFQTEPRSILTTQKENNPPTAKTKSTKVSKSLFIETNGKGTTTKYISTNGLHQIAAAAKTRAQKKQKVQNELFLQKNIQDVIISTNSCYIFFVMQAREAMAGK